MPAFAFHWRCERCGEAQGRNENICRRCGHRYDGQGWSEVRCARCGGTPIGHSDIGTATPYRVLTVRELFHPAYREIGPKLYNYLLRELLPFAGKPLCIKCHPHGAFGGGVRWPDILPELRDPAPRSPEKAEKIEDPLLRARYLYEMKRDLKDLEIYAAVRKDLEAELERLRKENPSITEEGLLERARLKLREYRWREPFLYERMARRVEKAIRKAVPSDFFIGKRITDEELRRPLYDGARVRASLGPYAWTLDRFERRIAAAENENARRAAIRARDLFLERLAENPGVPFSRVWREEAKKVRKAVEELLRRISLRGSPKKKPGFGRRSDLHHAIAEIGEIEARKLTEVSELLETLDHTEEAIGRYRPRFERASEVVRLRTEAMNKASDPEIRRRLGEKLTRSQARLTKYAEILSGLPEPNLLQSKIDEIFWWIFARYEALLAEARNIHPVWDSKSSPITDERGSPAPFTHAIDLHAPIECADIPEEYAGFSREETAYRPVGERLRKEVPCATCGKMTDDALVQKLPVVEVRDAQDQLVRYDILPADLAERAEREFRELQARAEKAPPAERPALEKEIKAFTRVRRVPLYLCRGCAAVGDPYKAFVKASETRNVAFARAERRIENIRRLEEQARILERERETTCRKTAQMIAEMAIARLRKYFDPVVAAPIIQADPDPYHYRITIIAVARPGDVLPKQEEVAGEKVPVWSAEAAFFQTIYLWGSLPPEKQKEWRKLAAKRGWQLGYYGLSQTEYPFCEITSAEEIIRMINQWKYEDLLDDFRKKANRLLYKEQLAPDDPAKTRARLARARFIATSPTNVKRKPFVEEKIDFPKEFWKAVHKLSGGDVTPDALEAHEEGADAAKTKPPDVPKPPQTPEASISVDAILQELSRRKEASEREKLTAFASDRDHGSAAVVRFISFLRERGTPIPDKLRKEWDKSWQRRKDFILSLRREIEERIRAKERELWLEEAHKRQFLTDTEELEIRKRIGNAVMHDLLRINQEVAKAAAADFLAFVRSKGVKARPESLEAWFEAWKAEDEMARKS